MLKDFKKFVLRGNAVDLAVAVVIGAAFGSVVTALVKDIFTPIIAAIAGKADFSTLSLIFITFQVILWHIINLNSEIFNRLRANEVVYGNNR